MSNNPVNVLMQEHEVIKKIENNLEKLNGLWEQDAGKYKSVMKKILHFLKEYSDNYHHRKEEEVLFPALIDHPDFLLDGIITELNEHHENFREYAGTIAESVESDNFLMAHTTLKKYLSELLDHIAIENDELFIMAENLFSPSELETLFFRFKDVDMEIGESKKAELEKYPGEIEGSF